MSVTESRELLVEKLKSKGILVHANDSDVFSFSIDGVCFTISADQDWGYAYLEYEHGEDV